MFFDFDALEAALPSITEDLVDPHQAEESSPVIPDRPEVTRSVEEAKPCPSHGMFKEMSDQHYRRVQQIKEQDQPADGPNTWIGNETRISCWHILEETPGSGGTPESGDDDDLEEASHTPTLPPTTAAPDDIGYDSEVTQYNSDESGASIFGLRRAIHEVEKGDELSDS